MERAERRRKEIEEAEQLAEEEEKQESANNGISFSNVEQMDVDDDFDFDEDLEACNAPSTRKSNSEQSFDKGSPFLGENILSFSAKASDFISEDKKVELDYEVPTKSAQLEADMRNLKDDIELQREYLRQIDPPNLVSIFSSSIE